MDEPIKINLEEFAQRLRRLREEKGLTQEELGQILGVKRGTVAAWEARHRTPELSSAYKAAQFFNVSVDYLLGSDPPNGEDQNEATDTAPDRGADAPSWWDWDTPPDRMEIEEWLRKAPVYFNNERLDEEDIEDIITYLQVKWEREKRKRQKEGQKGE